MPGPQVEELNTGSDEPIVLEPSGRTETPAKNFPIVGIGASAGGLDALTELLRELPAHTGMAFVIVQHMDPKHESALDSILARSTNMPVAQVNDGVEVEPDHVYIIPPNAQMRIERGRLRLEGRPEAMEERVREAGGSLEVRSIPKRYTELEVHLPLKRNRNLPRS